MENPESESESLGGGTLALAKADPFRARAGGAVCLQLSHPLSFFPLHPSTLPPSTPPFVNMAERKVTSKYFPPDFDPAAIEGKVKKAKKDGLKSILIRLMAPFSMKCAACGEFIYKGRKFNARKETLEEKYLNTTIFRFYIRCTNCQREITFRTDPKSKLSSFFSFLPDRRLTESLTDNDYMCEKGATRNYEKWRNNADEKFQEETQEETLDRLERERGEEHEQQEKDKMADLEDKMKESKREMHIADALDEIRTRNARVERNEAATEKPAVVESAAEIDDEEARFEAEIAELARKAFRDEDGVLIKRLSPEEEALLKQPFAFDEEEPDWIANPRACKRKRDAEREEAKKKQFPWKILRPSGQKRPEQKKRPE